MKAYTLTLPLVFAAALDACGSASNDSLAGPRFDTDAGTQPRADVGSTGGAGFADGGLPRETGETRSFQTPQGGARHVYVANPARDHVEVIDAETLAISSVEAGDGPTYLATVPNTDTALVLDVNAPTLALLQTTATGTTSRSFDVVDGANAIAIAPDAQHAVVFLDTAQPNQGVPAGSFQEISVLDLRPGHESSLALSVGFRPTGVTFSGDGATGYVVTEDGVTILDFAALTGPRLVPTVSFRDDAVTADDAGVDGGAPHISRDATVADVAVTRDGHLALARVDGTSLLRAVDLRTRVAQTVDLGSEVTDLDVAPDGSFAVAALRSASRVVRIPLPDGLGDAAMRTVISLPGEVTGSVTLSPDGARALVYSSVAATDHATLLDLAGTTAPSLLHLRKPVRAVAFAPDGRTALVVHRHADGDAHAPGLDLATQIDRSPGYSLLDCASRFSVLALTDTEVGPFMLVPDGSSAFVLLRDDARNIARAQRVSLANFTVRDVLLGSPPVSVGAVSLSHRVFIGQDHPEGRITFVDWSTGTQQSVTGFELNSRIVE